MSEPNLFMQRLHWAELGNKAADKKRELTQTIYINSQENEREQCIKIYDNK